MPKKIKNQQQQQQQQQQNLNQNNINSIPQAIRKYYSENFTVESERLGYYINHFCIKKQDWSYLKPQFLQFQQWMDEWGRAHEEDLFTGELEKNKLKHITQLSSSPSIDILYQNFKFFDDKLWKPRFTNKFTSKIYQMKYDHVIFIYCYISLILEGKFYNNIFAIQESQISIPYNQFFTAKFVDNKYLLCHFGVERVPTFDRGYNKITKFDYKPYIRFVDIITNQQFQTIGSAINRCIRILTKDSSRGDLSDKLIPIKTNNNFQRKEKNYLFQQHQTEIGQEYIKCQFPNVKDFLIQTQNIYYPNQFQSEYLTQVEMNSFILDSSAQRWVSKDQQAENERKKYSEYMAQVNKSILDKYADFSSAGKLVELLQKIPNFKIQLTDEEMDTIGQNGNVMVIGRSGTGKTTCSVLRMFSIEMLFKLRVSLYKQKQNNLLKDTQFDADDVDSNIGLHCVFVTASPVLTNEVKRYYKQLTSQIKEELEKKRQRKKEERLQKKKEEEEKQKAQQLQDIDEKEEFEIQMKEELCDLKLTKKVSHKDEMVKEEQDEKEKANEKDDLQINDIDDDEELEEQENMGFEYTDKINSLNDLTEEDFPGFFTIKRLILLVDACLRRPFFSRNQNNEIIGQDSQANWHNETKGVLMIDQYHRKLKAGKEEEELQAIEEQCEQNYDSDEYEDEEELEEAFQRQIYLQQKKQKQAELEKSKFNPKSKRMAFEVDYNYFKTHFWPRVAKQNYKTNIAPDLVWTQIYSYIKGGSDAHQYVGWYVSKYVYVYANKSTGSNLLSQEQRMEIFEIFLKYERWKGAEGGYDLMDVVNYILVHLDWGDYNGKVIHYIMIDEIQDLPQAVIMLLMKVTQQGFFFSGDTAQTIAQGVGFRFQDLRNVFTSGQFGAAYSTKAPAIKQLTTNFRSHNKILELANSIVTSIEIFFPLTIDKLKKERSNIDGPKPILLQDADPELLFYILCKEEEFKSIFHTDKNGGIGQKQPLEFGCNQVIIVRDQESKKQLPAILQHALVLTVYEAKGLEFDDVILYNFFKDSKVDQQKWNLLKQLEIESNWMEKDEFINTITQHQKEQEEEKIQEDKTQLQKLQELNQKKTLEQIEEEKMKEKKQQEEDDQQRMIGVFGLEQADGKVNVKKVRRKKGIKKSDIDIQSFSQLCTELKQLYVAVTRPKNRLIIYDEDKTQRQSLENFWRELSVVEVISKSMIEQNYNQSEEEIQPKNVELSREVTMFRSMLNKTTLQEWKKQGLKMFKHKYYEQAMKCFERSKDEELYRISQAYWLADDASKKIIEIENEIQSVEQQLMGYRTMQKFQRKKRIQELKKEKDEFQQNFVRAGEIFVEKNKYKHAAQCYFSAKLYKEAEKLYVDLESWRQAGEAAYLQQDYAKAAGYYDQSSDYIRVIECFDIMNKWEDILKTIDKYKNIIPVDDIEVLIKKYAPLAFEKLVKSIDDEEEDEQKDKKDDQIEEKIDEEDEEDNYSDSDDDEEEEEEEKQEDSYKNENEAQNISKKKEDEEIDELDFSQEQSTQKVDQSNKKQDQSISNMSFSIVENKDENVNEIEKSIIQKQKNDNISEISFSIIDNQNKNASNNETSKLEDFEHLSHIDMQDEWLQMEKGSVIESISEARQSNSNIFSDYSAIEVSQAMAPNVQLVQTKADIFVQDTVMSKIIEYANIISKEFQNILITHRSAQSLITKRKDFKEVQDSEYDMLMDFIADLDNIDPEFIYLVLDILETFKIYKLCIFVCNRYKLSQRLGRYVLSLSQKYSPLSNENASIVTTVLQQGRQRQIVLEKAFVSSVVFHNILENINPEYLKGKREGLELTPQNSLGIECYQGLVLLGYWKKILYMLDYENGLALTSSYSDFKTYKQIFLMNSKKYQDTKEQIKMVQDQNKLPSFDFLPFEKPESKIEIDLCCIALEHILQSRLCHSENDQFQSSFINKFYKDELQIAQKLNEKLGKQEPALENIVFPAYFAYNGALWNYLTLISKDEGTKEEKAEQDKQFVEYIISGFKNLKQILDEPIKDYQSDIIELRIFDLITFVTTVCSLMNSQIDRYKNLFIEYMEINDTIDIFDSIFTMLKISQEIYLINKNSKLLIRGLFSPFGIRLIENNEILDLINTNHVLVHRSSVIIPSLLNFKYEKYRDQSKEGLVIEEQNKAELKKRVVDEIYFADVDQDFVLAPFDVVLILVKEHLYSKISGIFKLVEAQQINKSKQQCVSYEIVQENAYNIAQYMGLGLIIENIKNLLNNDFKENLDIKKVNFSNQSYTSIRKNDVLRRFMKIRERKQQQYDVVDGDEEIKQYLLENTHLKAASLVKQKNKKPKNIVKVISHTKAMKVPSQVSFLKQLLNYNIGKSIKPLNKYSIEVLMMLSNYYIQKGLIYVPEVEKNSTSIITSPLVKAKQILDFIGNEVYFYEVTRLIRKRYDAPKTFTAFRNLDDALLLKQYGMTGDYSDCIFNFIENKISSLSSKQILSQLVSCAVYNLVAYIKSKPIKDNTSQLVIPSNLVAYIPGKILEESIFEQNEITLFQDNISSFDTIEILSEIVYWIHYVVDERLYDMNSNQCETIFVLILTLIINLDNFEGQIFNDLLSILDTLQKDHSENLPLDQSVAFENLMNSTTVSELKQTRQAIVKNYQFVFPGEIFDRLIVQSVSIVDQCNIVEIEKKSERDYLLDMKKLATRLQAQQKIKKFLKDKSRIKKLTKFRSKIIKSPIIYYSLSQQINSQTAKNYIVNLQKFSQSYQGILEFLRASEQVKRSILNTYLQTYVNVALDFHYIALQLKVLSDERNKFIDQLNYILQFYDEKDIQDFVKKFVKTKQSLEDKIVNFGVWKEQNVKYEINVKKLFQQKKKIHSVKWLNRRGMQNKTLKLAKKRAGLKKQRALQEKKERLNFQKQLQ